jgi:benzodiazapine receptor
MRDGKVRGIHYVLIPAFYAGVALAGRAFTAEGLTDWYPTLVKPSFTPPGSVIGIIWTLIYVLTALAFIIYVNRPRGNATVWPVAGLFIFNGVINALWSYIFFAMHMVGLAVADAALIFLSAGVIMVLSWPRAKVASLLLLPYVLWTSFATCLTYAIYELN